MRMKLLATTILALGMMVGVLATPAYLGTFRKTYRPPKDSALMKANCNACHSTGTQLNSYGKDVQKAMQAKKTKDLTAEILKSIEKVDSDKDGVSNVSEIKAGTLPGDPKSKP